MNFQLDPSYQKVGYIKVLHFTHSRKPHYANILPNNIQIEIRLWDKKITISFIDIFLMRIVVNVDGHY